MKTSMFFPIRLVVACSTATLLAGCAYDVPDSNGPTPDEEDVAESSEAVSVLHKHPGPIGDIPIELPGTDVPVLDEPPANANKCSAPGANCGLTWVKSLHDNTTGQDRVSCHDYPQGPNYSCDPYVGDTDCNSSRPILCIRKDGSGSNGYVPNFYDGWAAGNIGITHPIQGTAMTSLAVADAFCAQEFGPGWQMAEHHDGGGGWAWRAYGNIHDTYMTGYANGPYSHSPNRRFWVHIDGQAQGNCW